MCHAGHSIWMKKKIWMLTIRSVYKYYGSAKTDLNWNYAFSHSFGAIYGFSIDFGSLHIFVVGVFSSFSRVHCWLKRLTRFVCYFKIMSQDPFNSVFIVYGFFFLSSSRWSNYTSFELISIQDFWQRDIIQFQHEFIASL